MTETANESGTGIENGTETGSGIGTGIGIEIGTETEIESGNVNVNATGIVSGKSEIWNAVGIGITIR